MVRKPLQTLVGAGTWDDEAVMPELWRQATDNFHDLLTALERGDAGHDPWLARGYRPRRHGPKLDEVA